MRALLREIGFWLGEALGFLGFLVLCGGALTLLPLLEGK